MATVYLRVRVIGSVCFTLIPIQVSCFNHAKARCIRATAWFGKGYVVTLLRAL